METVTQFLTRLASNGIKLSVEDGRLNCYAQKGALTGELKTGILAHKAELIALLDKIGKEQAQSAPAAPARPARFPLSAGQKGLYILQKLNPSMTAFNVPMALSIRGDLDVQKLGEAWAHVLEQFPILSARIVEEEGTPVHEVSYEGCRPPLRQETVALSGEELLSFLRERGKQPFDLNRGPLTRLELFTRNERERTLLLTVHHMIFDGVSVVSLLRSLFGFYQQLHDGKPLSIARNLPGYQEFVAWEESLLASAEGQSHADYWQQQLSGDLPTLELFADQPRPSAATYEGTTMIGPVPEELSSAIRVFAKAQNLRPSAIFLAAFQLLLNRYTNQDDIIVGMPVIVRPAAKFMTEVGYFMNMLPLRTRCTGTEPLSDFLRKVQRTMLDGVYHASFPFELMLDRLDLKKASSRNPVFQVNYAYQNFVSDSSFTPGLQDALEVEHVREIGPEGYSDFALEIFETETAFRVHVKYNPGLYESQSVERFLAHYNALLKSMSEGADLPLQEYSILPEEEKRRLLVDFNDTRADYPKEKCIHDFFAEQVAAGPDRIAAAYDGELLTYQELYDQSRDLGLYLQSLGVRPESIVGLCFERSLEMMLGIMGTVQAGGAYMPLDPDYPDDRLTYMIEDSQARVVLTQAKFTERVRSLVSPDTKIIVMDREWVELRGRVALMKDWGIELRREVKPDNLCYVIYTSGSTGRPKGVLNEHRGLVNRIHWMQKAYQLDRGDIVLQKTPYSFDVSVWEFFWPMMTGSSVVFARPEGHKDVRYLETLIDEAGVTTLHFVPSMLRAYLEGAAGTCDTVKRIFASGEALDKQSADHYPARFPNAVLHNLYGPTEAAIDVTYFPCDKVEYPFVPIGKPIDNIQLYILDPHNQLQPIGIPGELHIAGDGLARGYLNRPELTEEKFVANHFTPGTRMYRTGDLARWMDDGNIQYLGRIDTQVKIRGFRIELGEIEARLNQHPRILDSAVIAKEQDGSKQLVAFYRAADDIPADELRAHLGEALPDYMVPSAFARIERIPLSSNGKVDRRALSRVDVTMSSTRPFVAPRTATEKQLVAIWADVLGLPAGKVGVNDNFFELGGHSLRAAQLISRIRTQFEADIPLKAFFEGGTVAELARVIAGAEQNAVPTILPANRSSFDRLPLSFAQERLWFINELEPESAGYNLPAAVVFNGDLDVDQLERAFNVIIARHENLRTVFPSESGRPYQRVLDRLDFQVRRVDLSGYAEDVREEKARELCQADATTPFDLTNGPLVRCTAIRLAGQKHLVMLNLHHIVSDAWSHGVLLQELGAALAGLELPALPIQYADYAVWQRTWLEEAGILDQQLAYWQQKLTGAPESLDLPTDFPRPAVQSFVGTTRPFALDAQLTAKLKRLADEQGGTLYMVLLAAFKTLLHRYTGHTDICVGSPIANRQYGETEGLIGMFVNTLALRSEVSPNDTFADLLAKVKRTCLDAYEHQDAPFEKVIDGLHLQRNLAVSPLFQTMVILQNVEMGAAPDARIERYPIQTGISKFDLSFEFTETADGLAGALEYSTALYKASTIERMIEHFESLCRAITVDPRAAIRDLDYLAEAEKRTLLAGFNDTAADYPAGHCLHELFIEQVPANAGKVAIVCGDESLTYAELYVRSADLALYLQSQGVRPDALVGVCMERTVDMVAGMLGILQAGGAYVPLDPNYPSDRLAYMIGDSRAAIVLTQSSLVEKLRAVMPEGTQLIAVDAQRAEIAARVAVLKASGVTLRKEVTPSHLSHVIYTSGSTGQPKGVAIEHHSPVVLVHWASEVYSREELAGVLAATSICFDLSVYEIFVTLANGGTIILVANALGLLNDSNRHLVTLINTVPSAGEELVRMNAIPPSVKTINLAGEPLSRALVDKLYESTPVTKVFDLYGPSEDTTYSTFTLRTPNGPQTIGRPLANTQVYMLDAHQRLTPIGVPGELHISGDGLAREYLNRPELTREKFVDNPYQPGTRMYKTGDLARWTEDGTIQYLGRIDTQVKVRGFRIEMGEIEARLAGCPGVKDVAVIAQGQGASKQLIAFYTGLEVATDELRAHLLQTLPDYMVPAAFVKLDAIPLNPNGKVDRRALSRIDVTMTAGEDYVAPRNETERRLASIFAEVLRVETVGIHDGFFDLGGHSLLATQLIARVREQFETELPLKTLFERNTVAQFAELIAGSSKSERPAITPADRTRPLPLSFAQERLWFINELEPRSAGYNVPAAVTLRGELDVDRLEEAFRTIVARHESLRTVFPSENGQARQQILDSIDFRLERLAATAEEARAICRADAMTPFDLAGGPLLRGKAIRIAEDEHVLMLNMHHIISDGWSIGVLIQELGALMNGVELAPLPIQYADYGVWQRQWLEEGGVLDEQLAYWEQQLAGVPESLDLATDFPRPSVQDFAGAIQPFALDAELTAGLKRLADEQGATLYMVLVAAFQALLHRYSGKDDICIGSPIANRQFAETEGLIGMFVNTLALRSRVTGEESFAAFLDQVKRTCLDAYEHQAAPFEKVVDRIRPQRNLAMTPIFQIMVVLQNMDLGAMSANVERFPLETGISKFDLTLELTETADGLAASFEYATALYTPQTIARMAEHFVAFCRAIVATPAAKVRELHFLGEAEKHAVLFGYNDTRADYPQDRCVHQLFAAQAALHGERTAVVCGDGQLTYRELDEKSRELALVLQSQGVGPDSLVGLCMERSLDLMVGLMAILQAGGAYVALDPSYPDDRLAYMLEDSAVTVVLTQEKLRGRLTGLAGSHVDVVALDRQWPELEARAAALQADGVQLADVAEPHHLAYVIYTSGSTGRPKGVMLEHRSVVNYLTWCLGQYVSAGDSRFASFLHFPLTFDASVTSLFVPLVAGKAVDANPDAGIEAWKDGEFLGGGYDFVKLTPAHLLLLKGNAENVPDTYFRNRNLLVVGGEALTRDHVDFLGRQNGAIEIVNEYGPTEATVGCTTSRFIAGQCENITIGTPIANTQIYILDAWGNPQPVGVPGELHIAGDCLARGYLNRPELTEARFVANPFQPGTRMYKTGDLARWIEGGELQYLGRIDTQVKIRGFRIEPGEIEVRLSQHAAVGESVVIAKGEGAAKQLVAFYTGAPVAAEELRAHLLQTLPDYMVPAAFVSLDAIPLDPNGKIDRRALSRIDVIAAAGESYVAARNETERKIAAIFAEVLGVETVGASDSFFALGGHSLLATQLVSRIRGQFGVDLPLKALFESPTVAALAERVAQSTKSDVATILPVERTERVPLSFAQERLWFLNQLEPESAGYNVPGAVTIHGALDADRLDAAFNTIIARHESLRTLFPSENARPYQHILDRVELRLERIDASASEAEQICRADAATPFDLANGPLLRGKLIRIAEDEHVLFLNMHHIISDGWSLGVLIREMAALLEGQELPALPIQYADYAVWQRNRLQDEGLLEQQLGYWQQKLAGVPESLDLPTDFPRPALQSFAGATVPFTIDAQLTGELARLAEEQGGTLYMVLLSAFKTLLHRYTNQTDLCVGSPIANRQYAETEGLIGMFVNTLALRSEIEPGDAFTAVLGKVKSTCLEAYEQQEAPFEKVVDALRLQRNLATTPLFQVMFILQNMDLGAANAAIEPFAVDSGISKFDLTVSFTESQDGLAGQIEYSTALYKPQTVRRMAEHFTALCQAITATPAAAVRDLDFLGADEEQRLLLDFNATQADYPQDKLMHQLFVEQVAGHASETAVVCGDEQLTYQQLYARSSALALYLQSEGVGPDKLVGVCMERSLDMIVAMFGILQAGGAYVPLDPNHPEDRLAYMIGDSRAAIVLTRDSLREKLSAVVPAGTRLIAVDRDRAGIDARVAALEAAGVALKHETRPDHLAYVIYTSGSTGNPKGVAIEHHSPVTLIYWAQDVYSREELRGVLAATSICFDLSVYEIFLTLATGGTIFLVQNALGLVDLAHRNSVTLINTVPSAMEELVRLNAIPDSVQTINLAGEPLPTRLVNRIYETTKVGKVFDLYGPSEDTTYSTFTLREHNGPQTIGRPIANTQVYILDAHNQIQPIGVPGELCIAGDGLCRGYLHRPELTEQKFVANPFQPGTRMYKTGDLARWMDDGTLQYLGRIDTQVKIRGFRIELGEIEARLNDYADIEDAVVIATGQGAERQLVAFYCAGVPVSYDELRAHLLRTLPDYMVPAAFVQLEAIPLNPNGKVDRRALSRIEVTVAAAQEYVAPRNETERRLAAIWGEVLSREPETIGVNDNFFELGGHSLLATQLVSKIRTQLNVELPLKALFERSSVAALAELIATAAASDVPAIRPVDRSQLERLPLSFAQERLWFINQLEPSSTGYNLPDAVVIRGALDVDRLEAAFNRIIERHENLRTLFPTQDGRAQQRILDRVDFTLERIDARSEEEAREICMADAATIFDLATGPLFRGKVIRLADDKHILMLNMHHIISDGWSAGVLINELAAIMEGRELPPLPVQYADYAVWQRQWLEEGGVLEQQLGYWQQKLAGAPESLDLPADRPRPATPSFAGATYAFALDARLTAALRRLAEQQGGTLYMALMTAFKALLHRYTSQEDICVGTPIANRQYGETEALIGMFVNTLALRTAVEGSDTFDALLAKVKATCLEAYEHQDAPFEKVIDALRLQRNLSITPLFQVMLILQNAAAGIRDERIERYPLDSGISKFDLTFELTETPDGLAGTVRYRTALYERQTIERMVRHLAAVCEAMTATPSARIDAVDYLDAAEKQRLLVDRNDTGADYPREQCLRDLFAERVAMHPDQPAVVYGGRELTYQELYQKSCDLAAYLRAQGVTADSRVGLFTERSLDMVVGMFGILQAGGAYVPLDPDYPADRLQYMLADAAPTIVLTQERLKERLPVTATPVIALDSEWAAIEEQARTYTGGAAAVTPEHLAYVIYTSGSTGVPKGVMVRQRGVVNLLTALEAAVYEGRPEWARVSVNASFSFDSSVKQFVQLLAGRTLVLVPQDVRLDADALLRFISEQQIDVFDCTPSQLVALLGAGMFDGTRRVPKAFLIGGEAIDTKLWRRLAAQTEIAFFNVYGPAECTVDATVARITAGDATPHIGRPVANARIYILDRRGNPVPSGVVGEICIGGAGVARGYHNRPELTAERFVADRFSSDPAARLYRTGDLGRWSADGNIEFAGRNDHQVKLRGQRIELGEIETALATYPGVREAIVIAREDEPGEKRLVAYLTATGAAPRVEELRAHLLARLPQYMVPAAFVELEALPLTPNKKVDRKALPKPEALAFARKEYEAPLGTVEETLAAIWQELLHIERVGRNDDFFELGGHSLSAVQLMAKINRRFEQALPLAVLFSAPTVAGLAKLIAGGSEPSLEIVVPIQPKGDALPLFAVPGAGGNVLSLRPLGRMLGERQPLYALQAVGLDGKTQPFTSVEATARANVEAMKAVQPHGPYRLIGHSYGGVVAYEMARQLVEAGEEVSSVVLLDSVAPAVAQRLFTRDEAGALVEACKVLELELDADSLRQASHEENVARIVALLNERGTELTAEQFAAFYGVYRANVLCNRTYQPAALPRPVDVALYRATERRADLPADYGWSALLPSPLRIHDVAADHYSILENVRIEAAPARDLSLEPVH